MTRTISPTAVGAEAPSIGRWVPTAIVHAAFMAVAAAVFLLAFDLQLFRRAATVSDVTFYLLLAGVHLMHVLRSIAALLPWHGRTQVSALLNPLRRFLCVQAVVQPVAFGALFLFGAEHGRVQGLSMLSAALLGVMAVVLHSRLRTDRTA